MRPLSDDGYRARLRLEFIDLPSRLRAQPDALLWAPFGPPLNVRLAPRTVWISQNLLPLLPRRELELSRPDRLRVRALRTLFSQWAQRARRTICVSSHARDRLATLARVDPASIAAIPHGVDPVSPGLRCSTPDLEQLRATRYVFHAGQPVPYRRTRELFAAFALLCKRRPELPPLVVAGKARGADRRYEEECLAVLAPLQHAGRARVVGQISHADTLALMGNAHTFAYPSIHEDCPNVVLEALSAARVGVYADIPAVRELAADAGMFVADPNAYSLAEALERAAFDPAERTRLMDAATQRARLFDWDRTAERTAAVLERAAGKDGGCPLS
jgi:glycosyltransferase involved in cell wall biosynthesis